MLIGQGDKILFQGDSVTDMFRLREHASNLGQGYANIVGGYLYHNYAKMGLTIQNTAISGNTTQDLHDRWDRDTMALRPTLVSIQIGINDVVKPSGPTVVQYESLLRHMLTRTKLAGAGIILMEPWFVPLPMLGKMAGELEDRWEINAELAKEFGATYIPTQSIMETACTTGNWTNWVDGDGVHPRWAGNWVMAEAWLKAVGAWK